MQKGNNHCIVPSEISILILFSSCRSVATSAYDGRGGRDYRHYPRESGSKSDGEQNTRQRRQQHYYRGHRSRAGLSDTYASPCVLFLSLYRVSQKFVPHLCRCCAGAVFFTLLLSIQLHRIGFYIAFDTLFLPMASDLLLPLRKAPSLLRKMSELRKFLKKGF